MSIAQTSTTKFPAKGQAGQKLSHPTEVVFADKLIDEAGGIAPGLVVVRGTNPDRDVRLPLVGDVVNDALDAEGFTMLDLTRENKFILDVADSVESHQDNRPVGVLHKGEMYVLSEDAVTAGGLVYVRVDAPGAEQIGAVRGTDVALETAVLTGWKFAESSTVAGALVKVSRY